MMSDFLLIVALVVIAAFFCQLRNMAEVSRVIAEQACGKQNVQLLAIAMVSARPSLGGHTGLCWRAKFMFEFSTDGMNQYRGHINMHGKKVSKIDWPIFPEPEWIDAPMAKGKFGGCGSSNSCNSGKCH